MDPEFIAFNFHVKLMERDGGSRVLCQGAFSEVSGLEATMAPKTLKEGGRNWGEVQLAGPVSFAPVILKRGITGVGDLWAWWDAVTRGANYALRYTGLIEVHGPALERREPRFVWRLADVLPTRFRGPDLSASAAQVAVEELHLVHQGLRLLRPGEAGA
jgi:phage tail-like protein